MADNLDLQLDELFAAYREACPDPEAGPEFQPGLWRRIEARRRPQLIQRITRVFVSASAALALLMALLLMTPQGSMLYGTYVEALDDDSPSETLAYADVLHTTEPGGETGPDANLQ
jgi:hypothetical protein